MGTPPLRAMLVDDHEVVRDGIRALLAGSQDVVVCAEAGSVREAVAEAERALPDVIVMDVRLSDGSGIEATRDIRARRPATQVLMLTSFADDEALFASIMAGASGYVLKQIKGAELVRAIRKVGRGQKPAGPGRDQGGAGPAAAGQAPAPRREAGQAVAAGGAHPGAGRGGADQPAGR
jgi:DNA-binding NarL/FixJ family response regulator